MASQSGVGADGRADALRSPVRKPYIIPGCGSDAIGALGYLVSPSGGGQQGFDKLRPNRCESRPNPSIPQDEQEAKLRQAQLKRKEKTQGRAQCSPNPTSDLHPSWLG